jgi:hypothetical protein
MDTVFLFVAGAILTPWSRASQPPQRYCHPAGELCSNWRWQAIRPDDWVGVQLHCSRQGASVVLARGDFSYGGNTVCVSTD